MIAARLRIETGKHDGRKRMVGSLNQDLPRGCLIMVEREGDEYRLIVVANDGRKIDRSPQSLFSFVTPDEPPTREPTTKPHHRGA